MLDTQPELWYNGLAYIAERRMTVKKSVVLIVISVVLTLSLLCACIFANAMFGNPVSKLVARKVAENYVDENYPSEGYEIEDVRYSFKDGYYHAFVSSEEHIDGDFTVFLNSFGVVQHDDYEYRVVEHGNVANRLFFLYKARVDEVLESEDFPYECDIAFGDLEFDCEDGEDFPENAIARSELINGGEYDIDELGKSNGRLVLYIDTDRADSEKASEILLEVRQRMDKAGVTFCWIDLTLRVPDGEGTVQADFGILDFKYEDIYEGGINERVVAAKARTDAYYEKMDAEKATELPIK